MVLIGRLGMASVPVASSDALIERTARDFENASNKGDAGRGTGQPATVADYLAVESGIVL